MLAIVLPGVMLLGGCNDTSGLAPASPATPWTIATTSAPSTGVVHATPRVAQFVLPRDPALPWHQDEPGIDPRHVYSLVELIDLAQSHNKDTRIAWEQARQAAISVGIARAAYLPVLTASALGGYQHIASPFPSNLVPKGYITANSEEVLPELAIRYLLLDFGSRASVVQEARQLSFVANIAFTAAHQTLILAIARAYFMLDGVNAQLAAAHHALRNAQLLQRSSEDMQSHGLTTIVNVKIARRNVAQAQFDLSAATTVQHNAIYSLLSVLNLPPMTVLQVEDSSDRALPRQLARTVDQMMQDALRQRPDLLADLARLRATDAEIAAARSAFLPKLSLAANVHENIGEIAVDGRPYQGIEQPEAGVFLRFDWPIYAGGLHANELRLAQSKRAAADDSLQQANEQVMRQVAEAYDQLETGLQRFDDAVTLQTAAQAAFDAASEAYRRGVGTFTDAASAQTALVSAQSALAQAHSQSLISAASLAFATGELTSSVAQMIAPGPS